MMEYNEIIIRLNRIECFLLPSFTPQTDPNEIETKTNFKLHSFFSRLTWATFPLPENKKERKNIQNLEAAAAAFLLFKLYKHERIISKHLEVKWNQESKHFHERFLLLSQGEDDTGLGREKGKENNNYFSNQKMRIARIKCKISFQLKSKNQDPFTKKNISDGKRFFIFLSLFWNFFSAPSHL